MDKIELKDITFGYEKGRQAVSEVSLKVGQGIIGLLGPNGAGKSTLMKIIMGFLAPQKGRASVLGKDVRQDPLGIRRQVGYMPEVECWVAGITAINQVALLGELSGMERQEAVSRAHEVLFYVGIEEARYRPVDTFSTGMKQRVKLAAALVHDPALLILDEPTSGMDPQSRKEMLELVREVGSIPGKTVLFSSHILADIESTCREVLVLDQGRLVATRALGQDAERLPSQFRLRLRDPRSQLRALPLDWTLEEEDAGFLLLRVPEGVCIRDIFSRLHDAGGQIRHLAPVTRHLSDSFKEMIEEHHVR